MNFTQQFKAVLPKVNQKIISWQKRTYCSFLELKYYALKR
jgi:hypothetical protein